jgi:hypothetical protein
MADTVVQIDRRLPVARQLKQTYYGPKRVNYYQQNAVNPNSTTTQNYSLILPSGQSSGVSRTLYRRVLGSVTLTDTTGGAGHLSTVNGPANAIEANYVFTLRPNCMENCTAAINVDLTNAGISLSQSRIGDFYNAKMLYSGGQRLSAQALSVENSKMARFNTFTNYALDASGPFASTSQVPTSDSCAMPTSAYITDVQYTTVVQGAGAIVDATTYYSQVQIFFEVQTPIAIGMFEPTNAEEEYLYGIDRINIQVQMQFLIQNFLCVTASGTAAAAVTNATNAATAPLFLGTAAFAVSSNTLYYSTVEVDAESIPRLLRYPVRSYQVYSSPGVTVPGTATLALPGADPALPNSIITQTIPLSSIPWGFLIYIKPTATQPAAVAANELACYPDIFLPITSLQCQFDNSSGLFSLCQQSTLYNLCRRNGLTVSYPEFIGKAVETGVAAMKTAVVAGTPVAVQHTKMDILNGCPVLVRATDLPRSALVGESKATNIQFTIGYSCNVPILNANTQAGPGVCNLGFAAPAGGVTHTGIQSYDTFVVAIYEDLYELDLSDGATKGVRKQIYIDEADIASATYYRQSANPIKHGLTGSGFWSDLADTGKSIVRNIGDIASGNWGQVAKRLTGQLPRGQGAKKGAGTEAREEILRALAK